MFMKRSFALSIIMLFVFSFIISWDIRAEDKPIGAEFVMVIGAQSGPFKTGTGFYLAGELGLPIYKNLGPGKLMGLINIGWAKTDDDITFEPTINAVAPGALPTKKVLI